jgi:PAS domain S-box-containing protein
MLRAVQAVKSKRKNVKAFQDLPIKYKVITVLMLTSLTALLFSAATFMIYDLATYRQTFVRYLLTASSIVADNSAACLMYADEACARETLGTFRADRHVVLAALYDEQGHLMVRYPGRASAGEFPPGPTELGYRSTGHYLVLSRPVVQNGHHYGTLYVKSDLSGFFDRLRLYGGVTVLILAASALVALLIANALQRRITQPILGLVETAKVVSERNDVSVRAPKSSEDELGLLTDAFNQMLARIQEAEKSRSFLAAIVDSSDDGIIGKDLNGIVVSWNAGAERMFGYAAHEMIGQPIMRLISRDRPDEEALILAGAQRGKTQNIDTIRIRKDGQPIDVSLTISPIKDAHGRIIGVSSIARDVTARRQAERALAKQTQVLREQTQMLDLANVLIRDLQDRIILWNHGMEKLYGWSKAEAIGAYSHILMRTEFPESLESIRSRLFSEGHWEGELVHYHKDGTRLLVASQWVLHSEQGSRPTAILEVNNDITERKHAEEQVRRLNAELELRVQERTAELTTANKELEAFTYSVAHDLRAPLRHIDAFSKILYEDFAAGLPQEAQRYLASIRQGSLNMNHLVDDLLNLARVGRQELKRLPTPLHTLVEEVVADLKRELRGRSIEWQIQPLPTVECDPGLMKQVFANLLGNAVKYTRPRPLALIEVGCEKKNGDSAIFVRDNGVGFSMKYLDKLFGVFQRLHRAEEFEGTGVGLATVERIIRKHGGTIWAEAAVDKGATFYFMLPGLDSAATPEGDRAGAWRQAGTRGRAANLI